MTQYPHDRFDDVPAYSDRKGSHRADPALTGGPSGLVGISVAAALALVVGAFCFLVLPSLLPSGASGTGPSASAPATSSDSSSISPEPGDPETSEPAVSETEAPPSPEPESPEPSETAPGTAAASPEPSETESETAAADTGDTSAPVEVYNASSIGGLAGRVSGGLSGSGFTVVGSGNWQGFPVPSSAVYYSQNETTAQAVAAELGLPLVQDARVPGVAVVLNADYSG